MTRLAVPKTYKLYIGGKFPRSESGRVYPVATSKGVFLANAAQASRKDARDAVVAARAASSGWAGATGYNRGQVLYRIAELLEGRRAQFVDELRLSEGLSESAAQRQVDAAIDVWVWYAGWADKYVQVAGNGNPVSGPYFNISTPEATGVVAIIAPQDSSLLGLVSVIAPALVSGNTVVVVASERAPLAAISLSEVLATSDVARGDRAVAREPCGRERARPERSRSARRRSHLGRSADRGCRDAQASPCPGEWGARDVSGADHVLHRDKDGVAYQGHHLANCRRARLSPDGGGRLPARPD